jgi:hypothetical protein
MKPWRLTQESWRLTSTGSRGGSQRSPTLESWSLACYVLDSHHFDEDLDSHKKTKKTGYGSTSKYWVESGSSIFPENFVFHGNNTVKPAYLGTELPVPISQSNKYR